MVKLNFYVPPSHLEQVKNAVFAVGAGKQGNYTHCCWQTLGQGQFYPLAGSQSAIGDTQHLNQVEEYRVEMVCDEADLPDIIQALKQSHPYEEPAYECYRILQ